MKIGIFSDFYFPSTNGVVFVVDILQKQLQKQGHKVLIVAPRPGLRERHSPQVKGVNVLWVPAIDGLFFDEYLTSVFAPSKITKRIEDEQLDAVLFITPGQIGMLGAYVAKRLNVPLIQQYSTDIVNYAKHYKTTIPALFALFFAAPIMFKLSLEEIASVTRELLRARKGKELTLRQDITKKLLLTVHNNCDAIISVSKKATHQLKDSGVHAPIYTIPTGVEALKPAKTSFSRKKFGIPTDGVVIMNVGRPTVEKNLELLIDSFDIVASTNKNAYLVIVGDSSYVQKLKERAFACTNKDRILFTGILAHEHLAAAYEMADIFAFTSLTDTQGLVLNEAAHAGLPIVWCDPEVNDVAKHTYNGLLARPNKRDVAKKLSMLIGDEAMREKFSKHSKKQAAKFSEYKQAAKVASVIEDLL